MFKKILAVLSTALIAAGLAVIAVAAPASAHHTELDASAVCTTDGGWDVTWSIINSENSPGTVTTSNNAAVPKDVTILPANPYYYSDKSKQVPSTFVQHVTKTDPVNLKITVTWKLKNNQTNTQEKTFTDFPVGCGDSEAVPVEPDVKPVTACGTEGVVTPKTTEGVVYSTVFDKKSGNYTVTAKPAKGYFFKDDDDQVITFTGTAGAAYDCVSKPTAVASIGQCVYLDNGIASDRTVQIVFDNKGSNKAVLYQVVGLPQYDTIVPPLGSATITIVPPVGPAGASFTVTADGQSFPFTAEKCPDYVKPPVKEREKSTFSYECAAQYVTVSTTKYTIDYVFNTTSREWIEQVEVPGTPVPSQRAFLPGEQEKNCDVTVGTDPSGSLCSVANPNTPLTTWIRVLVDPRVVYTFENTVSHVVTAPTGEYTSIAAGKYLVTAVAAPGFVLTPTASRVWPIFVEDTSKCDNITLPLVYPTYSTTPASCTTAGTYTIGAVVPNTIAWTVNNVPTLPGTYKVTTAGDITIVASAADPANGLDPAWKNPAPLKFPGTGGICELETLAYTGVGNGGMLTLAGGMVLAGLGGLLIARRRRAESK